MHAAVRRSEQVLSFAVPPIRAALKPFGDRSSCLFKLPGAQLIPATPELLYRRAHVHRSDGEHDVVTLEFLVRQLPAAVRIVLNSADVPGREAKRFLGRASGEQEEKYRASGDLTRKLQRGWNELCRRFHAELLAAGEPCESQSPALKRASHREIRRAFGSH